MIEQLKRMIFSIVARGRLTAKDESRAMRAVQAELLFGDIRSDVEHFEPYGFSSSPHDNSEPLCVSIDGDREHTIAMVVADRRYRIKNMKTGEVAIFDDLGRRVHLMRDKVLVEAKDAPVEVVSTATITLNAPTVVVTGDMTVKGKTTSTGDVVGAGVSLSGHVHTGDSGGTTSGPK